MFADAQVPRNENFNPDEATGVSWVKHLPKLNSTHVEYLDEFYRGRVRALQSVDELVGQVMDRLEAAGVMDNTYIFYTADNGFALGSHRRQPGKTLGYEEDIKVPLVIRGPGMPEGITDKVSSYGMVDLSRTFLDLAGAKPDYEDDGTKINLHQKEGKKEQKNYEKHRHSLSEYWLRGIEEGKFVEASYRENNSELRRGRANPSLPHAARARRGGGQARDLQLRCVVHG
jgi:arylsulfatase A-like enzyme